MSLAIRLGATAYLPLRAVPIITSGLLDTPTLAHMICDPDAYCDNDHDTVLSVYSYRDGGKVLPVDRWSFSTLVSKTSKKKSPLETCRDLPAGMLVRAGDARQMFDLVVSEVGRAHPGRIKPAQTVWNDDPLLAAADRECIFDGLPAPRQNSVEHLKASILKIVEAAEFHGAQNGCPIDRMAMPGTRGAWTDLICEIDSSAARSKATHETHFRELDLRWRPGSRPEQINPIRRAMGLKEILPVKSGELG